MNFLTRFTHLLNDIFEKKCAVSWDDKIPSSWQLHVRIYFVFRLTLFFDKAVFF